jgi:hypothetical protein
VTITYQGRPSGADVTVSHGGRGAGEPWDASGKTGGRSVEVGVPFASLGITIHSTIRFKVESQTSNQIRDGSAEVQYSPVPTLGVPLLVGLTAVAILAVWWFVGRKQWRR